MKKKTETQPTLTHSIDCEARQKVRESTFCTCGHVTIYEELLRAAKACEDELSQIQFSVPDALTKKITLLRKAIANAEGRASQTGGKP